MGRQWQEVGSASTLEFILGKFPFSLLPPLAGRGWGRGVSSKPCFCPGELPRAPLDLGPESQPPFREGQGKRQLGCPAQLAYLPAHLLLPWIGSESQMWPKPEFCPQQPLASQGLYTRRYDWVPRWWSQRPLCTRSSLPLQLLPSQFTGAETEAQGGKGTL